MSRVVLMDSLHIRCPELNDGFPCTKLALNCAEYHTGALRFCLPDYLIAPHSCCGKYQKEKNICPRLSVSTSVRPTRSWRSWRATSPKSSLTPKAAGSPPRWSDLPETASASSV